MLKIRPKEVYLGKQKKKGKWIQTGVSTPDHESTGNKRKLVKYVNHKHSENPLQSMKSQDEDSGGEIPPYHNWNSELRGLCEHRR